MIQNIIIKKILDIIAKQFKLDEVLKYVKEPNELDEKVSAIQNKLKKLEKLSHPVSDFVCTKCGTKAKRVKKKLNKLKEKF
tara:strand:+ start:2079 stop:2321 length:243 start_codon:yes stop_codon:yes gene_type:complete